MTTNQSALSGSIFFEMTLWYSSLRAKQIGDVCMQLWYSVLEFMKSKPSASMFGLLNYRSFSAWEIQTRRSLWSLVFMKLACDRTMLNSTRRHQIISNSDCDGRVLSLNEFNFPWYEGNPVSHLFVIASWVNIFCLRFVRKNLEQRFHGFPKLRCDRWVFVLTRETACS